jgi:hypothetical protein
MTCSAQDDNAKTVQSQRGITTVFKIYEGNLTILADISPAHPS